MKNTVDGSVSGGTSGGTQDIYIFSFVVHNFIGKKKSQLRLPSGAGGEGSWVGGLHV